MANGEPNPYQWRFFVLGILCLGGTVFVGLDAGKYAAMMLPLSIFGSTAFALGTWIHLRS